MLLFSESASRFLAEVPTSSRAAFEKILGDKDVPFTSIGEVADTGRLQIAHALGEDDPAPSALLIDLPLADLKEAWQKPLRW